MRVSPATPHSRKSLVSKRLLPAEQLMASKPMVAPFIGAEPPERHAARVVAAMARWLVHMRVYLDNEVVKALRVSRSYFGSPKAQERFAARLRKAGGQAFLDIDVKTGKRGRGTLFIATWHVYDPTTQKIVDQNDNARIPDEPWLAAIISYLDFKSGERGAKRLFVVSHHALMRLVQRCGAREPLDLIKALAELYARVVNEIITKKENLNECAVRYFDVAGGTAVFKYDEMHRTMVVATVLDRDMCLPEQDYGETAP